MATPKSVMIIAGEASGDQHAAHLVKAMKRRNAALDFYGIGGRAMKENGVEVLLDATELSVVGITEVLVKLPTLLMAIRDVKRQMARIRPDLLILLDFPDFNLHIAATAKKLGIPVLYYISPQIWAWRAGRIKKIKRRVDHMAVIFPFEASFYKTHGVPVTFVGHPLMDDLAGQDPAGTGHGKKNGRTIALLPGSRDREVSKHLPIMLSAAELIRQTRPDLRFIVSAAPSVGREAVEKIVKTSGNTYHVSIETTPIETLLAKCDLALAVSGTVTLQTALYATPMIIIYRVSPMSYWLGRLLIKVDHIGLANLVSGETIVPELIQKDATPENIAGTALELMNDPHKMDAMRTALLATRERLGEPGAADRVADIAFDLL